MKEILNYQENKITKIDIIIITIITLIYTILSFINLGSKINPNTFSSNKISESIVIELKEKTDIDHLRIFNGHNSSDFSLAISDDNKEYKNINTEIKNSAFAWNDIPLNTTGKYLKLTFKEDSTIGELAIYNTSFNKLNIKKITKNNKTITTMTDEQNTIPKKISYLNSSYFDEIYFARTAYEYTKGQQAYEWVHPPLGKLIQAIPIYLTKNMSPFNYRLMGNISGIILVIVMYFFGKELFKKRKYAIFSSMLMILDTFHFAQTRMGTIDSHLVLFITLSLLFMYKFTKNNSTKHLFLSGLFFALSISCKWTGFYGGLSLAIIYFLYLFKTKQLNLKYIFKGLSFFVLIPSIIYISLYLLFPNNNVNYTNSISNIIEQQKDMYNYHSTLKADHFFYSKWYTWPVVYKPVWYYTQEFGSNKETISSVGNLVIWWMGILSFLYMIFKLIKKKDQNSLFLIITILSILLPYALIPRGMFLYHFFPILPFMMLGIILMFKDLVEKTKKDYIILIYLTLALIFFIIYYPVVSGKAVDKKYIEDLKLFNTWYF